MTRFALDDLKSRVKEAVYRDGLRPFAAKASVSVGVVRSILGDHDPKISSILSLANALGLHISVAATSAPEVPALEIDGDDFTAIPRLAVEASAGGGALNDDTPEIVGKLAFRRDWLRKIGVRPERAMLITVTGDSMAPELRPGDLALIDQDRNTWEHNRVMALVDLDGSLRIKRVLLDPGRAMVLTSDNPAHPPELRTKPEAARLTCLGRVVWSGRHWE